MTGLDLSFGMWDPVPRPGIALGPLRWKRGILTTGPPGKPFNFRHVCGKGCRVDVRCSCVRTPRPSANPTPAASAISRPSGEERARVGGGCGCAHGLGCGQAPGRRHSPLWTGAGSLGRKRQARALLPAAPREGPSRMPASRTEGCGYFQAEGSSSGTGWLNVHLDAGCRVGTSFSRGCGLPLPMVCPSGWCSLCSEPHAASRRRARLPELQSVEGVMDDVSVRSHSARERNRTLRGWAASRTARSAAQSPSLFWPFFTKGLHLLEVIFKKLLE